MNIRNSGVKALLNKESRTHNVPALPPGRAVLSLNNPVYAKNTEDGIDIQAEGLSDSGLLLAK